MKLLIPGGKYPGVVATLTGEGRWRCKDRDVLAGLRLWASADQVKGYHPDFEEAVAELVIERWPGTVVLSKRAQMVVRRDVGTTELAMKIKMNLPMDEIVRIAHEQGQAFVGVESALMATFGVTAAELEAALHCLAEGLGLVAVNDGFGGKHPGEWMFGVPMFGAADCFPSNRTAHL